MICIVCNVLETRMSSKGKKFIEPIELFRLVKNREDCRELKKAKGCPGKGVGGGRAAAGQGAHQEEYKDEADRRTVRDGLMLGAWLVWEVQWAYLMAAGDPIFPLALLLLIWPLQYAQTLEN